MRPGARHCGPSASAGSRRSRSRRERRRGRAPAKPRRRRRSGPADVEQEIMRLGGRNGERLFKRLMDAADAYAHDREREALRLLRPLRDQVPDSPSVRELVGLCQYRRRELQRGGEGARGLRRALRRRRPEPGVDGLLPRPAPVAEGRDRVGGARGGVAVGRRRRRRSHRLRRRACRPGPRRRQRSRCSASVPTRSATRRSTTCVSGTRSPISRSAPATSLGRGSCSTGCATPTPSTSTSPSGVPRSG